MLFPIFVFGNNRNKRSARGADPTTARTPVATASRLAFGSGDTGDRALPKSGGTSNVGYDAMNQNSVKIGQT